MRGHEDEVLNGLTLNVCGDHLHVAGGMLRQHGSNLDVDNGDAQSRLRKVQRLSRNPDRDLEPSLHMHGRSPRKVPVVHLAAVAIDGRSQMPAVGDIDVIGEVEETRGHGEVLASIS